MKVFLSGAIENVGDLGEGWRLIATDKLEECGYEVITPLVDTSKRVLFQPNEIVARNLFLQQQADILLVEMAIPNRNYIGSVYEMVRAQEFHQPTVVWADQSYLKRAYLCHLATVLRPSLMDALDYIYRFYPVN